MDIKALVDEIYPYIIDRRRYYHAHPELTHKEVNTRASIHNDLEALGITDIRDMKNCYGLVATIHGGHPGKTVGLRADIDALPVKEETGLPFCSEVEGCMHACGHDCHIAMLLGAAKVLNSIKDELHGNIRLIVQPAEELCEGANLMIAEGAMDGVDVVYGNHVWGSMPAMKVSVESGPRMAYAGIFEIDIEGLAAHGASPHLGFDAITAAAAVINNLQLYISRMNDPLNPIVMTLGTIEGGTRFNVIPNHVHMTGSVRAYTAERHIEVMTPIIEKTCEGLGCKGTLTYRHVIGPVINNYDEITALAQNTVRKLYGDDALGHQQMMLGSEDFGSYMTKAPGVFAFIGTIDDEHQYSNHHEKYDIDENILRRGVSIMAQFALDYMETHS